MLFYSVLIGSTGLILILLFLIWEKTKSISFILGIFFLYYWSLYGGWSLVVDKMGGDSGMHYSYLEDKLFAIHLDEDYFWTLVLYATFIITVEVTLLAVLLKGERDGESLHLPIRVSHLFLLILGGISGLVSYLIIERDIQMAVMMNMSAYAVTRGGLGELSPFFTIHQELNRLALIPAVIGFAILCSGKNARLMIAKGSSWVGLGYLLLLGSMFVFCASIGNKNELFYAGVGGCLFYIANSEKPHYLHLTILGGLGLVALWFVDMIRGFPIPELLTTLGELDASSLLSMVQFGASSNEAFGAHFSMYGALNNHLSPTYGSSLVSLVASIIPRFFWAGRPDDIYIYYADGVAAVSGQGYAIHHATGWYLNFGLVGVLIGAIIFGWVWGKCFNCSFQHMKGAPRWFRIFSFLAPWMVVAYIPSLIRAGPEAYKGLIIEGFILPTLVLTLASVSGFRFSFQNSVSNRENS